MGYLASMLKAALELPIEKGDVLLTGHWKNVRTVVEDIGEDEDGQPTVNGKPILNCRIEKTLPEAKKSRLTRDGK